MSLASGVALASPEALIERPKESLSRQEARGTSAVRVIRILPSAFFEALNDAFKGLLVT